MAGKLIILDKHPIKWITTPILSIAFPESEPPTNQYHQCCFDEEPMFYKVTFIDFDSKEEKVFDHVMKTNGDNCTLTSDNVAFHTDEILSGDK
ncbi:hypothetical protein QZH41_012348, partial [Actinostola sp. cb2023]